VGGRGRGINQGTHSTFGGTQKTSKNPNQNSQFYLPNVNLGLLYYELWVLTSWPLSSIAPFYGKQQSQEPNIVVLDCSVKILCVFIPHLMLPSSPPVNTRYEKLHILAISSSCNFLAFCYFLPLTPLTFMHHHPEHSQTIFWSQNLFISHTTVIRRSQWPNGLRRGSAAARFLGLRVRISPRAWTPVSCEC
jgi:hypothetical protein